MSVQTNVSLGSMSLSRDIPISDAMAKKSKKESDLFASGGGNATSAGVTTQASIAASIAVQMVADISLDSRLGLGTAKPVALLMETAAPVDDILVETDAGGWVFAQSKNSLTKGTTLTSELGKTCDEFARLWLIASAGDGSLGWDRPLLDGRDAMVLAVGHTSSAPIKNDLPAALNAMRMGSLANLNEAQRLCLDAFRKLMRSAFDARNAPASINLDQVLKFIHVLSFDFGGPAREAAEARLAILIDEPSLRPAAFKVIERECQTIMTARGRLDALAIRTALSASGIELKPSSGGTREAILEIKGTSSEARNASIEIREMVRALSPSPAGHPIVTNEAELRLRKFRQSRFILGFDPKSESARLSHAVEQGDLATASVAVKQSILAWCSRVLATTDFGEASRLLVEAEKYGSTHETVIAGAFLKAYSPSPDKSAALAMLAPLGTPEAMTASAMIAFHEQPPEVALKWLTDAGLSVDQLDPDGKYRVLGLQLTIGDWDAAIITKGSLSETDLADAPGLLFLVGTAHLGQAIHPDLREILGLPLPNELVRFPLGEDPPSLEHRAKAIEFYKRATLASTQLLGAETAPLSSDRALWLELRDSSLHLTALKELQSSMSDEKVRLRRVPMAVAFGLRPNVAAIETDIERAMALSGGKSTDAVVARLVVALMREAPEVADYIEAHREQLTLYYNLGYIVSLQVEALTKAGRVEEARAKLADNESEIDDPQVISLLRNLIDEAGGADAVSRRESEYASQPTIASLINLVDELRRASDNQRLAIYAGKLFYQVKDLNSAELYTSALYETNADQAIVEFFENNASMVDASDIIKTNVSWAYYRLGRLQEAKSMLERLRSGRDVQNDRALSTNIAVASGDWSSLSVFVESEWSRREERKPNELMRAGALAQRIGSARSQELIREAARRAEGDPNLLVSAYDIASSSGWENDDEIHQWLATAIERSGEEGPIRRIDIREIIDEQPRWSERVDRTWELLLRGEAPMFVAAQTTRRTLLDFTLRPALQNLEMTDPRRRSLIFAFAGNRSIQPIAGKSLAVDITSLVFISFAGHLRRFLDWCTTVTISHTTLTWLFEERSKLAFHQPSQVRRAKEVKRLLEAKQLYRFESDISPPALEQELGQDVAKFLVAAQTIYPEESAPRIIVRSYPLYKPGSLLEEEADISGLESYFAGCVDLVNAIHAAGHLTEAEYANAVTYLQLHEKPWPHSPTIPAGSTLYLDDLTVSYLQHLKLLPRLSQAGFKASVSASEVVRAQELVNFDESALEARDIVEDAQSTLRDGIASGKVKLGPLLPGDEREDSFDFHPSRLIIADSMHVDALVIDDRYVNKYASTNTTANITSIDVFIAMHKDGVLSPEEISQSVTRLRQAGLVFVPFRAGELVDLLKKVKVVDSRVQETAELRAIRESVSRIRMSDALQLPSEAVWLDTLTRELLAALRSQWQDTIADVTARACSEWILRLLDVRGWTHVSSTAVTDSVERYRAQVLTLLLSPSGSRDVRQRYWKWLDDVVLGEFKEEQPEAYRALLETVQELIDERVEIGTVEDVDDD